MNVGVISPNYPVAYSVEKAQKAETHKSFAKSMEEIIQESGVGAIGSVNESGDIVMDSVCDNVNDLLTVVYKTQDFDPENPVYKVKTWDTEGNVTERMIDVSKINTKNCNSFEILAYTTYLWDSGKADRGEIMRKFSMLWAVKNFGPNGLRPCNYSEKANWVKEVQHTMQLQYDVGNLAGYIEWKKFLELLEQYSINDNGVITGYMSKKNTSQNLGHFEDGMSQISEPENKYCSLCGSRIKADGTCPICIIPTFISGNKQSHNQNISLANSNKLTMLPRNSKVGRKV